MGTFDSVRACGAFCHRSNTMKTLWTGYWHGETIDSQKPSSAEREMLAMPDQEVLANQKVILDNQKTILANQGVIQQNQDAIKKNQHALDHIQKNQYLILKNQEKILALVGK